MERKKLKDFVISFDFDGTITLEDDAWPNVSSPNMEMIDTINFLYNFGFLITINSLRDVNDPKAYLDMTDFLRDNNVQHDYINENAPHHVEVFGGYPIGDPRKVSAAIYVDDRNAGGLVSPRIIVRDVIVRYSKRIKKGYCLFDDEIDEQFIDAWVEKYIRYPNIKTTLRRTKRDD